MIFSPQYAHLIKLGLVVQNVSLGIMEILMDFTIFVDATPMGLKIIDVIALDNVIYEYRLSKLIKALSFSMYFLGFCMFGYTGKTCASCIPGYYLCGSYCISKLTYTFRNKCIYDDSSQCTGC